MDAWIRFWTIVWVGWSDLNRRTIDFLICAAPDKPNKQHTKGKQPEAEQPEQQSDEDSETAGETPPAKAEKEKPAPAPKKAPAAGGSPALRIGSTLLAIGAVYGTPWTTRIMLVVAAAWTVTALALGYLALTPEDEEPAEDDQEPEEPDDEPPHPSETLTLNQVAWLLADADTGEGSGVHLATLRDQCSGHPLGGLPAVPWQTRHVRSLLARHGVRVRPGVRVPPVGGREGVHRSDFPPPPEPGPEGVVGSRLTSNNNSNNTEERSPREGLSIIPDPSSSNRWLVRHEPTTGR